MIVLVPRRAPRPNGSKVSTAWPFDIEHRPNTLRPGGVVEEELARRGERHLHALQVEQPALATARLTPEAGFELAILRADYAALLDPANPLRALLAPDLYWLQVRSPEHLGAAGGRYRLELTCVLL